MDDDGVTMCDDVFLDCPCFFFTSQSESSAGHSGFPTQAQFLLNLHDHCQNKVLWSVPFPDISSWFWVLVPKRKSLLLHDRVVMQKQISFSSSCLDRGHTLHIRKGQIVDVPVPDHVAGDIIMHHHTSSYIIIHHHTPSIYLILCYLTIPYLILSYPILSYRSICLSVCLSIYLSIYLYVYNYTYIHAHVHRNISHIIVVVCQPHCGCMLSQHVARAMHWYLKHHSSKLL